MDEKQNTIMEKQVRISVIEAALRAGDYKIIKLAEAKLTSGAEPYDAASVIAERQKMRDEINLLQAELSELEGE